MTVGWPRGDRFAQILLIASAVCGLAYWGDSFGLAAPYPWSVALKASGIVLLALFAAWMGRPVLAAGLAAGAAGDAFLALQPEQFFFGMAAFAIGHLIYVALYAQRLRENGFRGRAGGIGALAFLAAGLVGMAIIAPGAGDLRIPVMVYTLIIVLMAVTASLARTPMIALIGAILFVISDTLLGLGKFGGGPDWLGTIVWPTYHLAQLCIALGLSMRVGR